MSFLSFAMPAAASASSPADDVFLAGGATLFQRGGQDGLWRVSGGVIRLDQRGKDTSVLVSVALPGDLIGYETLLGQAHSFDATVLVPARLRRLTPRTDAERQALMVEALLLQPQRSHDMARMRTGPVLARVGEMLRLLGFMPAPGFLNHAGLDPDALRSSLPPLRELAEVVDAKPETVCRALAQLLPPRTRKGGPKPGPKAFSRQAVTLSQGQASLQGAWG
ncbi:cyclic nucleotide-binding domain-containing protein [Hydrogenophaga soli]|nr:hypothetical protein [Burkholderiaceae bacterium]